MQFSEMHGAGKVKLATWKLYQMSLSPLRFCLSSSSNRIQNTCEPKQWEWRLRIKNKVKNINPLNAKFAII